MPSPSPFGTIAAYPGDPILSLYEAFEADPRPTKVNLGIGIYTDEDGAVPVLPLVAMAHERLAFAARPYLPMDGHPGYRAAAQRLVFGASHPALAAGRVATVQTVGGTGGVALAADFLARHCPGRRVYVSDPPWDNHHGLFGRAGFETWTYPYWDAASRSLDAGRMMAALARAEDASIIVVQPVCHNPTGLDLDAAQEAALTNLLLAKRHIVVFDMAYQDFGSGLGEDAGFVRRFAGRAAEGGCLVVSSFSKTFSLYGERCGALSVVTSDADEAERALGQLKLAVRRSYSSPPTTGALLVATVLTDVDLRARWEREVADMRERMAAMRHLLAAELRARSNAIDADLLLRQRGMFSFTGLGPSAVAALRERDGVYLLASGRMCVAGHHALQRRPGRRQLGPGARGRLNPQSERQPHCSPRKTLRLRATGVVDRRSRRDGSRLAHDDGARAR